MRFFSLIDFQYMVLVTILGLISAALVYVAWGGYPGRKHAGSDSPPRGDEGHEVSPQHRTEYNPAAPFIIFVIVGVVVWIAGYTFYMAMRGGPVW